MAMKIKSTKNSTSFSSFNLVRNNRQVHKTPLQPYILSIDLFVDEAETEPHRRKMPITGKKKKFDFEDFVFILWPNGATGKAARLPKGLNPEGDLRLTTQLVCPSDEVRQSGYPLYLSVTGRSSFKVGLESTSIYLLWTDHQSSLSPMESIVFSSPSSYFGENNFTTRWCV